MFEQRIIVTGGAGFIGSHLCAKLLDAGHEVLGKPDPGWNPGRYVPSTARIRQALGVRATVDLDEAIRRTAASHRWNA